MTEMSHADESDFTHDSLKAFFEYLDLGALDGVVDALNPFLHVLADHDFLRHPAVLETTASSAVSRTSMVRSWKASGVRVISRLVRWSSLDADVLSSRSVTCSSTGVSRT